MKKNYVLMMMLLLSVLACKTIADPAFDLPDGYNGDNTGDVSGLLALDIGTCGVQPPFNDVALAANDKADDVLNAIENSFADRGKEFPGKGAGMPGLGVGNAPGADHASGSALDASHSATAEVPEPTTLAMLSLGCLVFVRKKKA